MTVVLLAAGCGTAPRTEGAVSFPHWTAEGFSDAFAGPAGRPPSPIRWTHDLGGWGWGNTELQCFTDDPANALRDGEGRLRIVARKEDVTCADGRSNQYTSARLISAGRFGAFRYGRIEARVKFPSGRGLLPVIWALGDDFDAVGWPASGEIDVAEVRGSDPTTLYGTLHGPAGAEAWELQNRFEAGMPLSDDFHVYAADWAPDGVRFLLDGRQYGPALTRADPALPEGAQWPFDKPFRLLLSMSVGNVWEGPPDESTVFPAEMVVDWIRVLRQCPPRLRQPCGSAGGSD